MSAMTAASCKHLDDDRVPVMPVNIVFATPADWDVYGVSGALSYKNFIRERRVPASFPYTALTYTGYGGVLLLCDVQGAPQAYDLSCLSTRTMNFWHAARNAAANTMYSPSQAIP